MGVLVQEENGYKYNSEHFNTFAEALRKMAVESDTFEFDIKNVRRLNEHELKEYIFMVAITQSDFGVLLRSQNYAAYKRLGTKLIDNGDILFNPNPLYSRKLFIQKLPPTAQNIYTRLFPMLNSVYGDTSEVICENGRFTVDSVLTALCAAHLFHKGGVLENITSVLRKLDDYSLTQGLSQQVTRDMIPRVKILLKQLELGEVTEPVTFASLKSGEYNCKSKESWGDSSYIDTLLNLPKAFHSSDYILWFETAAKIVGKDCIKTDVVHTLQSVEEPKVPEQQIVEQQIEEEVEPVEEVEQQVKSVEQQLEELLGFKVDIELVREIDPVFASSPSDFVGSPRINIIINKLQERSPMYMAVLELAKSEVDICLNELRNTYSSDDLVYYNVPTWLSRKSKFTVEQYFKYYMVFFKEYPKFVV